MKLRKKIERMHKLINEGGLVVKEAGPARKHRKAKGYQYKDALDDPLKTPMKYRREFGMSPNPGETQYSSMRTRQRGLQADYEPRKIGSFKKIGKLGEEKKYHTSPPKTGFDRTEPMAYKKNSLSGKIANGLRRVKRTASKHGIKPYSALSKKEKSIEDKRISDSRSVKNEEIRLNERAPKRKHHGARGRYNSDSWRDNTQKKTADDYFSHTSGYSTKPIRLKNGGEYRHTDDNGKLKADTIRSKKIAIRNTIEKSRQIKPKLPKDR